MHNVEYNICSSKYVSIHLTSFVSHTSERYIKTQP